MPFRAVHYQKVYWQACNGIHLKDCFRYIDSTISDQLLNGTNVKPVRPLSPRYYLCTAAG